MNIGMVVFSQTGNTLSVATKLQEKLSADGHTVTLERLEVVGGHEPGKEIQFEALPEIEGYDALVIGAPVEAFSLKPVMKAYLPQVPSLQGKKVACLVTEAFPYAWMGGNRAVRQMTALCEAKGATVCGSGIVNWMRKRRDEQIVEVVDHLSSMFRGA